jgi:hypothetical protein
VQYHLSLSLSLALSLALASCHILNTSCCLIVDIMYLADRNNRNIVLEITKEVFSIFRLGKLPQISASVLREYTPCSSEDNPFSAKVSTISADTLQIGMFDVLGIGVLGANLVPTVSSPQVERATDDLGVSERQ